MTDPLKNLLTRFDKAIERPYLRADLVARTRERAKGRLRRRYGATIGLAALCVAAAIAQFATWYSGRAPAGSLPDTRQLRSEIEALGSDADMHLQVANAVRENGPFGEWAVDPEPARYQGAHLGPTRTIEPDLVQQLEIRRMETASILLRSADDLFQEPARRREALNVYRDLVRLFPNSPAARQARDRLGGSGV